MVTSRDKEGRATADAFTGEEGAPIEGADSVGESDVVQETEEGNGTPQVKEGNGTPQVEEGNGSPQAEEGNGSPQAEEGNAYAYNARSALALYGDFIEGVPNGTFMVVSSGSLPPAARGALEASASRLGYGKGSCIWVYLHPQAEADAAIGGTSLHSQRGRLQVEADAAIGAGDLKTIVECMDPLAVVTADAESSQALSKAYSKGLTLDAPNRVACRTVVAFRDFAAMLEDDDAKQRAWHALKSTRI